MPAEKDTKPQTENGGHPARKPSDTGIGSASLALAIPSLMAVGPLAGYFLGHWLGGLASHAEAGGLIGFALGFATAIREVIKILRRLGR